jgi:hypothetical protein
MNAMNTVLEVERQADGITLASSSSPRTFAEALPVFLRHASPLLLLTGFIGSAAHRLSLGQWSWWDLVPTVAIICLWPLQEWLIHVYLLHLPPFTVFGRSFDLPIPRKHREHHQQPWNYEILFIPIHAYLYIVPLIVLGWTYSVGNRPLAWTAITVHLALSLHYEWVHFLIHTRVQPRLGYYQRLWRNHRLHHFKNEHYWYGVTRLEGDRLLGTLPAPNEVPASRTCRTLYAQADLE